VKGDLRKPANAKRGQSELMFQAAELSFHGGAAVVEVAEPLGVAGDEWVTAVGLHPRGLGLTLAGRAAPLGRVALEVGTSERPTSVLTSGSAVLATFDGGRLAEGHDRQDTALRALGVHALHVIAAVHGACLGLEAASGEGVEKRRDGRGLVRLRRLYLPRDPQAGVEVTVALPHERRVRRPCLVRVPQRLRELG
jgi:hypothetical protein